MTAEQPGDLMTLDEMISRAELEPTLRDFYVEGRADVSVFSAFFEYHGLSAAVFAISDRVFVETEVVESFDQDYGERSKLIAAASVTARSSSLAASRLTFIIDADWADVTGPIPLFRDCLEMTDLPSLEHYFVAGKNFASALHIGLGHPEIDVDVAREGMYTALRDIAAARLTLKALNITTIAKLGNVLRTEGGLPRADLKELVRRSLNGAGGYKAAMIEDQIVIATHYREMIEQVRHNGRGHDIAVVLIYYLKLSGHFADPEVVEAILRASVSMDLLSEHPFFDRVRQRARAA